MIDDISIKQHSEYSVYIVFGCKILMDHSLTTTYMGIVFTTFVSKLLLYTILHAIL